MRPRWPHRPLPIAAATSPSGSVEQRSAAIAGLLSKASTTPMTVDVLASTQPTAQPMVLATGTAAALGTVAILLGLRSSPTSVMRSGSSSCLARRRCRPTRRFACVVRSSQLWSLPTSRLSTLRTLCATLTKTRPRRCTRASTLRSFMASRLSTSRMPFATPTKTGPRRCTRASTSRMRALLPRSSRHAIGLSRTLTTGRRACCGQSRT
mmetsp:Transcript_27218/g.78252  ORF Transcript_27218/g.78252 Transcript_27218/m.78252 type:complete len:209 (-) Transcript_27218:1550-2176(-)